MMSKLDDLITIPMMLFLLLNVLIYIMIMITISTDNGFCLFAI